MKTLVINKLAPFTVAVAMVTPIHGADLTSFGGNYQASLPSDHLASEVKLGDLDGDSDLDAWVVNQDTFSEIYFNDGLGAFAYVNQIAGNPANGVALGDVDGDGDLDAVLVGADPNRVWLNDGNGLFVDSGQRLGNELSHGVALGDVDGDGDLDAWVASSGPGSLWLNDGSGVFTDSGQVLGSADKWAWDVELGDVDGDLDLDAVVAIGAAGSNAAVNGSQVWLNDGSGVFTDSGQSIGSAHVQDVVLGNLDDDTDLDVFAASSDLFASIANRIWINDGTGVFSISELILDGPESASDNTNSLWGWSAALGDFNGDFRLDVFVANAGVYTDFGNRVYLNNGGGEFVDSGQVLGNRISRSVAMGDLTGFGNLDAFVANVGGAHEVWFGQSDGTFAAGTSESLVQVEHSHRANTGISAGDLNNNGRTDAVLSSFMDGVRTLANSGDGKLYMVNGRNLGNSAVYGTALGDLDGDLDLDAWLITDEADRVWINALPGSLRHNDSGQALGNDSGNAVALGDVDGDLDLDAWTANDGADRVWLNDGHGVFTDSGQVFGAENSAGVAFGDLDGDLDLDVWVANGTDGFDPLQTDSAFDQIWLNDGNGNFSASTQVLSQHPNQHVALGDLDGDLDLDAWVSSGGYEKRSDQIWINDGVGNFTLSEQVIDTAATFQTVLADMDGDGDLDAVCAVALNRGAGANTIWLNDGSGAFTKFEQPLGSGKSRGVVVLDADGDTDLDVAIAYEDKPVQLWINGASVGARFVRGEADEWLLEFSGRLETAATVEEDFSPAGNVASPLAVPSRGATMRFFQAR